jgi:lipopolysaccharide export system permease protein
VQKFNYEDSKSEILNFDNYVFNLTENEKTNDKKRWKAKERYLWELMSPEEGLDELDLEKYRTEIHQRFTYPLLPIIFSLIAVSCILRGHFSRSGNVTNIILAISVAVIFFGLTMVSYNLIETSPKLAPLLYLNFALFFLAGLKMLNTKS